MAVHRLTAEDPFPPRCRGGAVTVGNYDGVHLGHVALLAELRQRATDIGGPAVAVTFDPHPMDLLAPDRVVLRLTTPDDRAALLHAAGADEVVSLATKRDLLQLTATEFLDRLVLDRLAAKAVVEGFNFGFGRRREGNIDSLKEWCPKHGVNLTVVPPALVNGEVVSSSRVRAALATGDVALAVRLLGRPYRLRGVVAEGQRRGQKLGFPTANLCSPATLVPGDGVYAVWVWEDENVWPGAANVGPNPTFGEQERKVEAHLIGFKGNLYDRPLAIDFLARLRDTRQFDSADDLVVQLQRDVDQARSITGASQA